MSQGQIRSRPLIEFADDLLKHRDGHRKLLKILVKARLKLLKADFEKSQVTRQRLRNLALEIIRQIADTQPISLEP